MFLAGGNRVQGIEQLTGAEAEGVAGVLGGEAVAGPASEFASVASGYVGQAMRIPYNNPELVEGMKQFIEGMDTSVPTRWGAAGLLAAKGWEERDRVGSWF